MSDKDNVLAAIARELTVLTEPVVTASADPVGVYDLLSRMGWDLQALIGADLAAVETAARAVASALETLAARPIETLDDAVAFLGDVTDAITSLTEVRTAMANLALSDISPVVATELFKDLLTYLLLHYLDRRSFTLLQIAILLTLVEPDQADPLDARGGTTGPLVRLPRRRAVIRLDRLPKLLSDPLTHLGQYYIPAGGIATQLQAEQVANTLFRRIRNVIVSMGGASFVGLDGAPPSEANAPANAPLRRSMTVAFGGRETIETATGSLVARGLIGLTATIVPANTQGAPGLSGPGLSVTPFGMQSIAVPVDTWVITVTAGGNPGAFFMSPTGFAVTGAGAGLDASVTISRSPQSALPIVFGAASGTRLEIGRMALALDTEITPSGQDFGISGEIGKAALVIAAGDGDGFLQRVLPPEGIRTDFDLALGWSRSRGLTFRGSAGLDATFPVGQDIAGVLRIDQVHLMLRTTPASVEAVTGATVSVQLGPVKAAVERFGLRAVLTFPQTGGNLGAADLALVFQPPAGAALEIDAGVVTGGGYLLFDPAGGQYTGAVHLDVAKKLSITAFGLITTRMPDGSPGFSLLVLLSARFTDGIPLAYGFTLYGIGGLLGVNRRVDRDELRAGLRTGTIGRILFPDDPIRNGPQIVSDLKTVFPPEVGRFVFGPMVQIGWGTPNTVLTMDLALVLELPAPVRLFILGRLRLLLPEEKTPVIRLQLDALGEIDFESGDVALDAVLYDSQIAQFAVTGEMALRANFGAAPNFVLAVGGFHPRFSAPEGFPALPRMAISLAAGDDLRLRLDAYLALTSNTLQFGAHLDLYAKAPADLSIQGFLGFDTLIQFSPFGLLAEVRALVTLKHLNTSIMAVALEITLSGPAPWRAQGRASFTFLFLNGSVRFDAQFGRDEAPPPPSPVRVRPLLVQALRKAGNWRTQMSPAEHPIVSFRENPGASGLFVHPLADLEVRQRVVPLGRDISRFGNADVDGEHLFTIGVVGANNAVLSDEAAGVQRVTEFFAPAQFRAMTDDEKLVAPAFEPMQAGMRFSLRTYISGRRVEEDEMTYERDTVYRAAPAGQAAAMAPEPEVVLDETTATTIDAALAAMTGAMGDPDPRGRAPLVVQAGLVERFASIGAGALSQLTRSGATKYTGISRGIALKPPRFTAVSGGGLRSKSEPPPAGAEGMKRGPASYSEAAEASRQRLGRDPKPRRRVTIVPSYAEVLS